MAQRVDVEWRRGSTGSEGTYTFNPRPVITKPSTGQKRVEFKVPLMAGSVTQLLGKDSAVMTLRGVLVVQDPHYDDLDKKRRDLISGVGVGEGQLHIISNLGNPTSKHIFWKGVPKVQFQPQERSQVLEYEIEVLLSDPTENVV